MTPLTARQKQVLQLILDFMIDTGMPPTRVEIANKLGFKSANAAEDHLKALAKKGAIELLPGTSRGIRILIEKKKGLPLVGQVAAGQPILAEENIENHYDIGANVFHPNADYLLRVRGMSMRDAGILDGDLLAVHKIAVASTGQIVVARLDDEVTVKRFNKQGSHVTLTPENPDFDAINIDLKKEELYIEGIAVGVIRNNHKL